MTDLTMHVAVYGGSLWMLMGLIELTIAAFRVIVIKS